MDHPRRPAWATFMGAFLHHEGCMAETRPHRPLYSELNQE